MKKILYVLCFIFIISAKVMASNNDFVMVNFISMKIVDINSPSNIIIGGEIETKNDILLFFSKKSCFNEIKNKMLESLKYGAGYYDNGVYYDGGYGRFVCLQYNLIKNYIYKGYSSNILYLIDIKNKKNNSSTHLLSQFSKDFPNAIPYIVKEEDIKNYTIFPLMENQKEARKLSDKLNREIKKELEKNK